MRAGAQGLPWPSGAPKALYRSGSSMGSTSNWILAGDLLDQIVLIHGVELGNIDDTALRQAGFTFFEENISSCFGAPQVRGQGADDNRADAAFVEDIVLNDDVGTKKPRT
jgi:hypothetical protein